jgi:hypothetical protein
MNYYLTVSQPSICEGPDCVIPPTGSRKPGNPTSYPLSNQSAFSIDPEGIGVRPLAPSSRGTSNPVSRHREGV